MGHAHRGCSLGVRVGFHLVAHPDIFLKLILGPAIFFYRLTENLKFRYNNDAI